MFEGRHIRSNVMNETLAFADIEIDRSGRKVRKRSRPIDLSDLGFDLLCYLAERAPDPVSNQELAENVWHQAHVSDQTVAQRVAMVRRALGDDAANPRFIRTVRGKGYAFIAPREAMTDESGLTAKRPRWKTLAIVIALFAALLTVGAVLLWRNAERPPVLLDPKNGALRLDNREAILWPPATAVVEERPVMIAGLTDWGLVSGNPVTLGVVCSLRRDRTQFTSAIDPRLQAYLDDPAKEADCAGTSAPPPPDAEEGTPKD